MKNILLIGVGGTGSSAVDILYQKIREFGNMTNNKISAVVFDTDAGCVSGITAAQTVSMADTAGVGTVCDRLGNDIISEWFPCNEPSVRAQEMVRGASQWRKKSYLAFLNAMNKQSSYAAFTRALENLTKESGASCEVYVIASIAGGTGSGSFIPIALFAKQYLRSLGKDPIVNAMVALPDIYAESQSPDNRIKIFANAYAILRELNAINQVARGYNREVIANNAGGNGKKKSPIKLQIGNRRAKEEKNQNVGLLFDSMDESFWTPEAAPFSQVFLLDRIPGIHSIRAHDIILANSLYTVLCTDIGAEFDSEYSNHATLVSQSNGSNAIYAGISTSQLRFPKETILDYLAHEKTLRVCEEEWLSLYRATEETILERKAREKERNRHFTLKDGDYAALFLTELENQRELKSGTICEIVDRATACYDEDGKRLNENTADRYFSALSQAITSRVETDEAASCSPVIDYLKTMVVSKRPWFLGRRELKATVVSNYGSVISSLTDYFVGCVELVRDAATPISEAVLTFNKNKNPRANEELSLIENLLIKDGKFVHPVTAMVQLCRLKVKLAEYLKNEGGRDFSKINTKGEVTLPSEYMQAGGVVTERSDFAGYESRFKPQKSLYARSSERFASFPLKWNSRTDAYTDNAYLLADAVYNLNRIQTDTERQLKCSIFRRLSHYVDCLIEHYRDFFRRFEEAKRDLAESCKTVLRKDTGRSDSVLNVFSSEEEKSMLLEKALGQSGEDEADVIAGEAVAGESVFTRCYEEAAAEITGDLTRVETLPALNRLFDSMIASYADVIERKNDVYKDIAKMDVFQAICESCRRASGSKGYEAALREYLSTALEIARPSLIISPRKGNDDSPDPKDVMVVMMSEETARHLKYDADKYGLQVPTDGVSEAHVLASCAEQFVNKYTGDSSVRVAVVKGIPSHTLYFTGEKMDVTPLRIAKFDEMSRDPVYYNNYRRAISFSERYSTDMWNPHIGYNLHKRGYLPYMNEAMEDLCDEKLFKALFYAISHDRIVYKKTSTRLNCTSFRYLEGGVEKVILGADGHVVDMKNVAQLIAWLRNQDALVDEWSDLFDSWLEAQKRALPNVVVESQRGALESRITQSPFIRMLRNSFFTDKGKSVDSSDTESVGGMGILEFAWIIKASEESMRDCDDAERILRVANKVFLEFCSYKVKPEINPVMFGEIYMQQLEQLFLALARGSRVNEIKRQAGEKGSENAAKEYFHAIVSWINDTKNFMAVPDSVLDESGNLRIDSPFTLTPAIDAELGTKSKQDKSADGREPSEENA